MRQPAHSGFENPFVHEVLEVGVGKIGLDEFGLFFQHGSHDVDDVVVEGDLGDQRCPPVWD